ncbi:MAG: PIN domain-containing protein [archaeon]
MLFFADSYALIDFVKGAPAYKKYFVEHEIITTKLNLLELYYSAMAESGEEKAEEYFNLFLAKTTEISDETLKKAAKFRFENKKRGISYIDAIGYQISLERKIKFLTGDKEFKGLPNVEFVK